MELRLYDLRCPHCKSPLSVSQNGVRKDHIRIRDWNPKDRLLCYRCYRNYALDILETDPKILVNYQEKP